MGQVPEQEQILLIGNGRLAAHLEAYYALLGLPLTRFDKSKALQANDQLLKATHVFLAVPDRVIASVKSDFPEHLQTTKTWVHFSGLLSIPGIWSAHPLMSFRDKLPLSLETYRDIVFIIESGGPKFSDLLPRLPNRSFGLPSENKSRYHALCVLAGNFSSLLWQKFMRELEQLGIPRESALPYLRSVTKGLEGEHWNQLIGPLARKDFETLRTDLAALKDDPYFDVFFSVLKTQGFDL